MNGKLFKWSAIARWGMKREKKMLTIKIVESLWWKALWKWETRGWRNAGKGKWKKFYFDNGKRLEMNWLSGELNRTATCGSNFFTFPIKVLILEKVFLSTIDCKWESDELVMSINHSSGMFIWINVAGGNAKTEEGVERFDDDDDRWTRVKHSFLHELTLFNVQKLKINKVN